MSENTTWHGNCRVTKNSPTSLALHAAALSFSFRIRKDNMAQNAAPLTLHHNNFDLLRFFLAAGVIVTHAYPLLLGVGTPEPLATLTHGQVTLGSVCVAGFFIISGFLVTGSWMRTATPLDFLKKRALRIFPGLAAALLVCILVVAPLGGAPAGYLHEVSTWKVLSILTMRNAVPVDFMPGVFSHLAYRDLDGTTWTLRFEFGCYLLVMALGLVHVFRHPKIAPVVVGLLLLLALAARHFVDSPSHLIQGTLKTAPPLVTFFLAGSLAYLLRERIPHSRLAALACVAMITLCRSQFLNDVLPFAGTYLLLYLAFSQSVRLPHFGGKVDLSYGLYLYGWPVEQLLVLHFGPRLTPLSLMGIAFPLSALLAWGSWTLVERPCLRLKTRTPRQPQRQGTASAGNIPA